MIHWSEDRRLVEKEFIRMGFDKDARWRISDINKDFELCNTYPRFLIVPADFKDDDLESVAKFRYFRRIPTAVWRHTKNGCFIVRSSQPTVGWFGWFRNELDENLVQSYVSNTMSPISKRTNDLNNQTNRVGDEDENEDEDDDDETLKNDDFGTNNSQTNNSLFKPDVNDKNGDICHGQTLVGDKLEINFKNNKPLGSKAENDSDRLLADSVADVCDNGADDHENRNNHNNNLHEIPKMTRNPSDTNISPAVTGKSKSCPTSQEPNHTNLQEDDSVEQTLAAITVNGNGSTPVSDDKFSLPLENQHTATKNTTPSPTSTTIQAPTTSKMLIIDARSYTAAMANRAKGGGCECSDYYLRCEVHFMNLANIHSIRKSYQAIKSVCEAYSEQSNNWLSFLDNSRWLHHISGLLKSALLVVDTIDIEEKSILIHCSDGWDRTPQLVALAEIMLDPYYRTFDGFKILVQREWLDFGHKFADRCGSNPCNEDPNEKCPVFLQWLDCVQQLLVQYPKHFEFNSSYLDKLNRHTYSNIFGTFSYNSTQERILSRVDDQVLSLWAYFDSSRRRFRNNDYVDSDEILRPSYKVRDLHFWKEVYLPPIRSSLSGTSYLAPATDNIDNKKFYDSLYIDSLTRTVCK